MGENLTDEDLELSGKYSSNLVLSQDESSFNSPCVSPGTAPASDGTKQFSSTPKTYSDMQLTNSASVIEECSTSKVRSASNAGVQHTESNEKDEVPPLLSRQKSSSASKKRLSSSSLIRMFSNSSRKSKKGRGSRDTIHSSSSQAGSQVMSSLKEISTPEDQYNFTAVPMKTGDDEEDENKENAYIDKDLETSIAKEMRIANEEDRITELGIFEVPSGKLRTRHTSLSTASKSSVLQRSSFDSSFDTCNAGPSVISSKNISRVQSSPLTHYDASTADVSTTSTLNSHREKKNFFLKSVYRIFRRDTHYKYSKDPNKAWKFLSKYQEPQKVELVNVDVTPSPPEGHFRVVCISDTHSRTDKLTVPDGDILIHAGDFSNTGMPEDVIKFNDWLGNQMHEHKIVIAGNHDITFDKTFYQSIWRRFHTTVQDVRRIRNSLVNCTYLEDSSVVVHGYKFHGTPWQPAFCGWGFNLERGKALARKWELIPTDTDIVISHGPPVGYCDLVIDRGGGATNSSFTTEANLLTNHVGDVDLLYHIQQRVKPLYHIFGHVHESYGVLTDSHTVFINASTCTEKYLPTQKAIVFDLPHRT